MRLRKIEKKYPIYFLIFIIGAYIITTALILSYNAAAISTLETLESESNIAVQNIPHIDVGESPVAVAVNEFGNIVYVANAGSNTVSVIGDDTLKPEEVAVGDNPESIAVNGFDNIAYVANAGSDTVSVINGTGGNFRNVANISVGTDPAGIDVDERDNIAYVANLGSNTVSVISGTSKQIQAGVSFDVNPSHAGRVECSVGRGHITVPTNQHFYVDFRTQCTAQANQGFQFSSWIENLESDSSRTISASQGDWITNTLDWLMSAFSGERKDTPATLDVTRFGTFTANFEELPPAIPPEYVATLFAVVASAFIGSWLTPAFVGWRRAKKQGKKLDYYYEKIKHLYEDGKLDKNDIGSLDKLRDIITDEYSRGKINKEQFDKLIDDISVRYHEIFSKEIDSVMIGSFEQDIERELGEIRYNIEDACAKGKINELHYTLLKEKLSNYKSKGDNPSQRLN